jgi:hypothetical protein
MKIVKALPPNFAAIKAAFNPPSDSLYCYGKTIFNPGGDPISTSLIIHESVHSRRQGEKVEEWWEKYIGDPRFRLDEEVLAHRAEYLFLRSRNKNADYVIERLCSPLYGSMISRDEAAKLVWAKR